MRENPEDRLRRLKAKKAELLEKLKRLRENPIRNHKRDLINDEINIITEKIMELQEVSHGSKT